MTRREKLIERLYRKPKDFNWDELISLVEILGYEQATQGKTAGSRRKFKHANGSRIILHQPHPNKILRHYQIEYIHEQLEKEGFL